MTNRASKNKIKMFFLPAFVGVSHIAPMVKAARLFASHPNVQVTIITTFQLSQTYQSAIDTDRASGHNIGFHIVKIPTSEVGLQVHEDDDLESILTTHSPDFVENALKLMKAVEMLSTPILNLVRDELADCLVIDVLHSWAATVAYEGNIPFIMFNGSCLFHKCCEDSVDRFKPHKNVGSDWEPFALPGLPHHVELTRSRLPHHLRGQGIDKVEKFISSVEHALDQSYCMMVNSFSELESKYVHHYNNVVGRKCCLVGPLHCYPPPKDDNGAKTIVSSSSSSNILFEWLDSKTSNSVLYVSFGSYATMCKEQFHEIAYGLEASGHPFIWVARQNWSGNQDDEGWFPQGFEARARDLDQGLVIKTWAPQEQILGHPNVGAFMTHCGWNSCQESLSNGVPVITWPLMAEQFYNECFMVDVLQVGIRVGNEEWAPQHGIQKVTVTRNKVDGAIRRMMNNNIGVMRKRVQPFVGKCKEAVQKNGSSYQNVCDLVEDLNNRKQQSTAMARGRSRI